MEPTTRLYAKTLSLAQLETSVRNDENAKGPLQALGHTKDKSAATFKSDMAPDKDLDLVPMPDGTEIVPPGKTKICTGFVWIMSQPAQVMAVR